MAAALLVALFMFLLAGAGVDINVEDAQRLITHPSFGVQVGLAVFLGVILSPRIGERMAVWVWIPGTFNAVLALYLWMPDSVLAQSTWEYYFTRCSGLQCADQMRAVMPFYTTVAYAAAAGARSLFGQLSSRRR